MDKNNYSVPKFLANGNFHDIMIAKHINNAAQCHENFSDHSTALQVGDSGGPNFL